ncbi:hypothetical protein TBLA_0B07150 [Henningerozyma blattae CBS 6284]|uniref:ferroxidase n=1 Tax=Henningerozyma blattae (strain ATCC 34711 / CBS 6284 / DSM 70876 / NBRC 10599 / NRRL Y-10934 / UCD 77-7) TaxID=1071380 RepID=I2GZI0_HENB6|nr:hypothetical protein TBLA_0B07150 [Tetrapisispora blattae CBS 6284]CCH59532.1 hypothetical protein TBLA_0B07150 [Tetrapisispora blattae CBS 6284]
MLKSGSRLITIKNFSIKSNKLLSTKTIRSLSYIPTRQINNLTSYCSIKQSLTTQYNFHRHYAGFTHGSDIPEEVINMTTREYEVAANQFLDSLLDDLEQLSEDYPTKFSDVELNQGVLTLVFPEVGTYVINKQPPNKQIWLSSPISGPNRFDYIKGNWVSMRNRTKLIDVLNKEISSALPDAEVNLLHD